MAATTPATPGPWRVELGERGCYHTHERILILANDQFGPLAKLPETRDGDWEITRANARLMASAPDLLGALKTAAAAINPSDRGGISLLEWNQRLKAATVAINAAIAKAEGR